ncbi:MAG: chromosome segregation protein SMC [Methanosarcinales archaeon]|nr:MAG: chromosome segregation protein SMC [Methanosarcinales archaeon]
MHITQIEFENFKSFGKKIKIPFFDGFTTISGPNGSGKSNIIDGILFCLGLSGSRAIRAEKLTDLIYNGGGKRPNYAQVTIQIDNTESVFSNNKDVIAITRKVKQTESGYYSYYYIDGKTVTLNEIHEQLSKAKVTPEGYNVVMQGDVTRIIQVTPFERRKIIDEIAGVSEFDNKKERSLNELEIVRERIERVDIIIEEVKVQLQRLTEERNQAIKYKSLREEKRRYEGFVILAKLNDAKKELDSIDRELKEKEIGQEKIQVDYEHQKNTLSALKLELDELNEQIMQKGEAEQIQVKKEIEEIKGQHDLATNTIELLNNEITATEKTKRRALLEINRDQEIGQGLDEKVAEEQLRESTLQTELDEKKTQMQQLRSRITEVDVEYADTQKTLTDLKNRLEECRSEKNELMRHEDRLLDATRRRSSDVREIEIEIIDSQEKINSKESDLQKAAKEIANLVLTVKQLFHDHEDLEKNRIGIKAAAGDVERELINNQREYMRLEAKIKAERELGGYSSAVESILKSARNHELEGIYGTIAELGTTDKNYSTALEIAAGGRIQAMVAATDEDASCAIAYLKQRHRGRATFLPLSKLKPSRSLEAPDHAGVIDYAINLMDYEQKFDPAFWYVFRDTLIVGTLSDARKLIGRYRMVTLEGEMIERGGAMTGGSIRSRHSFAGGETEKLSGLAQKTTELESRRNGILNKIDSIESHIHTLLKEIAESEKQLSKRQLELEDIKGRGEQLTTLINKRRDELQQINGERKTLKREMEEVEEKKTAKNLQMHEFEEQIHVLEEKIKGSPIPKLNEQINKLQDEINHLQNRIYDVKEGLNSINLERKYLKEKIEEITRSTSELETKKIEHLEKIQQLYHKIKQLDSDLTEKQEREKHLSVELRELQKRREDLQERYDSAKEETRNITITIQQFGSQMLALNATMEAVSEQITQLQTELSQRNLDENEEVPTTEKVYSRIKSIERAMERLEPVNMRAISEYDEVENREGDLRSRRDILFNERQELLQRITYYEKMKKDAFMEAYTSINKHFKEIFAELSSGTGEIILENPEDPFTGGLTIKARPSDKTEQRLEAMSGGEKSLTALALIFAIQMYRPAPFYAFDEIDMFLDGFNAERVARRIKKSSKEAQFIVVSLRKPVIEAAQRTVGVTMQENNISMVTGVKIQ